MALTAVSFLVSQTVFSAGDQTKPKRERKRIVCTHPGCGKEFRDDNFKSHQKSKQHSNVAETKDASTQTEDITTSKGTSNKRRRADSI